MQLPQMARSSLKTLISIHSGFGYWFLLKIPQFHTVHQSHCLFIRRTNGQIIPKLDLYVMIVQPKMLVCAHTKTSNKKSVISRAIWYHLYNLKNVKNAHKGVLLLVKLQATKSNISPSVFSRFLNCTNGTKSGNGSHIIRNVRSRNWENKKRENLSKTFGKNK